MSSFAAARNEHAQSHGCGQQALAARLLLRCRLIVAALAVSVGVDLLVAFRAGVRAHGLRRVARHEETGQVPDAWRLRQELPGERVMVARSDEVDS